MQNHGMSHQPGLQGETEAQQSLPRIAATTNAQENRRRSFVGLLVDSPNASKSARDFGDNARPDYPAIRRIAEQYGRVTTSCMFVNPGFQTSTDWRKLGYELVRGTDHDVDHLVVSTAMRLVASGIHSLVVVSGDHRFRHTQHVCARLGIRYVTVGIPAHTDQRLMAGGEFRRLPVYQMKRSIAAA